MITFGRLDPSKNISAVDRTKLYISNLNSIAIMNVFDGNNSQQVEWLELSISPTAITIAVKWPMNLLICIGAALLLTAVFFLISHSLRYVYRRRLNERMNYHLGRFTPRNPVTIHALKTSRSNAATVYVVPTSLMNAPPSYYELDIDSNTTSADKNSRAC